MSDKIRPQHVARKAILYVRQSSAYQVTHNLESQRLQYAMQDRLHQLGWRDIDVVDEDLGRSAAGTVTRTGFERMVAKVCLGNVGGVAAREVSRFARNSREWQHLVEVCRVIDTVLIDLEAVYCPRLRNDRLRLGLKGSLNEYELDLLRQRSVEARRAKAQRGELLVAAPVGFLKTDAPHFEKDPDRRIQEAVALVFQTFGEWGTVRQTLSWFLEHGLQLPARSVSGAITWRRPSFGVLYRMLSNPIYGGAYGYGKTERTIRYEEGEPRTSSRRRPREDWLAFIPHAHEGYVSWEEFDRIRHTMAATTRAWHHTGAATRGPGLVTGLLRCRRCGRKLVVCYTGSAHNVLRYVCVRGARDRGEPRCISFGGLVVDDAIGKDILRVVQPAAVDAAIVASEAAAHQQDEVRKAGTRELEAARYAARRAQKQYDATDPENRLVADELERRWNTALRRVREIEARIDQHVHGRGQPVIPTREAFANLAADLEAVWRNPHADIRLKKRLVRTLIHEIVVDTDPEAGEVILVIHWKGGVHTELRVPRRRRGQCATHTPKNVVDAVRELARICPDDLLANVLNRNGLLTGRGNRWTRERVVSLRTHHDIACYERDRRTSEGWMNLNEAARVLGIRPKTLRLAVERGDIEAAHPLPDGPWVFHRRRSQLRAPPRWSLACETAITDPQYQILSNEISCFQAHSLVGQYETRL
jgi:DNA invertase Pin-like site-specific DNA recombinase